MFSLYTMSKLQFRKELAATSFTGRSNPSADGLDDLVISILIRVMHAISANRCRTLIFAKQKSWWSLGGSNS